LSLACWAALGLVVGEIAQAVPGEIHDPGYALPHDLHEAMNFGGVDLEDLFARAFSGRHLVFVGDSTTMSMHTALARFLLVASDEECALNIASGNRSACGYDDTQTQRVTPPPRTINHGRPEKEERRRKVQRENRLALINYRPFNVSRLRAAASSMEVHEELELSCPDGDAGRARRCEPYFGVDEGSKELKAIAIRVPHVRRTASDQDSSGTAAWHDYALSVVKGQGAIPLHNTIAKLKLIESQQGGQHADIVIMTGGLHYLHLW
jgi:hypothetical protein